MISRIFFQMRVIFRFFHTVLFSLFGIIIRLLNVDDTIVIKHHQFLLFILQKSSNPVFMRTIVFGSGMNEKTDIKMEAYDLRERYTSTKTLLGNFFAILFELVLPNY